MHIVPQEFLVLVDFIIGLAIGPEDWRVYIY